MKQRDQHNQYPDRLKPVPHSWESLDLRDLEPHIAVGYIAYLCRMCGSRIRHTNFPAATPDRFHYLLQRHNETEIDQVPEDCYEAQQLNCCRKVMES